MAGQDWVIDVDAHVTEPGDVWTARLPAKLRDRGPRLERDRTGRDVWHVADSTPLVPVGFTAVAGWPEPFPSGPKNMDEVPPTAWDAHARLDYLDSIGVWAQVMYPNVAGFGNQQFLALEDPELMLACVRAYNDFLIEWCGRRATPPRCRRHRSGTSTRPSPRCAAAPSSGTVGSSSPGSRSATTCRTSGTRTGTRSGRPCRRSGCPSRSTSAAATSRVASRRRASRRTVSAATRMSTSVQLFLDNGTQIVDLLMSGVLARFPTLEFVSVESGIGFIPFILDAADYAFEDGKVWLERPYFEMKPSDYFRRQVYGCWFFEERTVAGVIDAVGASQLLFETDYPHPICLFGNVREKIEAGMAGQPDEVRQQILWGNAAELYRVDAVEPASTPA